jgi:selenide,water dikinase
VPLLDGAAECAGAGVLSSLHPDNIRCARAFRSVFDGGREAPAFQLLFDPQTSGGLLACLPGRQAAAAVAALRAAGYSRSAVIGRVVRQVAGAGGAEQILSLVP